LYFLHIYQTLQLENSKLRYDVNITKNESKQNEINNFFILNQNSTNIQKCFPPKRKFGNINENDNNNNNNTIINNNTSNNKIGISTNPETGKLKLKININIY
jgi:hypothetical protein